MCHLNELVNASILLDSHTNLNFIEIIAIEIKLTVTVRIHANVGLITVAGYVFFCRKLLKNLNWTCRQNKWPPQHPNMGIFEGQVFKEPRPTTLSS